MAISGRSRRRAIAIERRAPPGARPFAKVGQGRAGPQGRLPQRRARMALRQARRLPVAGVGPRNGELASIRNRPAARRQPPRMEPLGGACVERRHDAGRRRQPDICLRRLERPRNRRSRRHVRESPSRRRRLQEIGQIRAASTARLNRNRLGRHSASGRRERASGTAWKSRP